MRIHRLEVRWSFTDIEHVYEINVELSDLQLIGMGRTDLEALIKRGVLVPMYDRIEKQLMERREKAFDTREVMT